jgi:hypothetical protein
MLAHRGGRDPDGGFPASSLVIAVFWAHLARARASARVSTMGIASRAASARASMTGLDSVSKRLIHPVLQSRHTARVMMFSTDALLVVVVVGTSTKDLPVGLVTNPATCDMREAGNSLACLRIH